MSQPEVKSRKEWTCPKCACVYDNGWQKLNHMKVCDVVIQEESSTNDTTTHMEVRDQCANIRAAHMYQNETIDQDAIDFSNAMLDKEEVLPHGEVRVDQASLIQHELTDGGMPQYTQKKARSLHINDKDLEILLFLQSADAGNGTSQAQKNTMLQYVKGFNTPRTRLLPRWIPTCYRRMDKVMSICVILIIYVTLPQSTCNTYRTCIIAINVN
jgi:hypothetical protein